ncbi:MAG: hypothetical protein BWX84_01763 [Verrucomicrobia bacterium ADurb.Bin118]|jgi:heme/copper-type cytochrome/quinol oxidase subunit 2|nr:MAG: hypothetical protein BWX84_01763 [Verrucomicrobia bacterium ADurb.Bin118]
MDTAIVILIVLVSGIVFGVILGFMIGFSRSMREAAKQIHGAKNPLVPKLFIGTGCVLLVAASATAIHTWHFTRTAQRTTGTILEMRQKTDKGSGDVTYAPTFQFEDAAGAQHTVASSFYSSPPEFHVGDNVSVLYRPDAPRRARIVSFRQLWALPIVLGVMGVVAVPLGVILLKRNTPPAEARRPLNLVR